jgi:hypothetical protein
MVLVAIVVFIVALAIFCTGFSMKGNGRGVLFFVGAVLLILSVGVAHL